MNVETFASDAAHMSSFGVVLSTQERSAMQSSLYRLRKEHSNFQKLHFWGKIKGIQANYLICQGFSDFNIPKPASKLFYSLDGVAWKEISEITTAKARDCEPLTGYFTGDPSFLYKYELPDIERLKDLNEAKEAALLRGEDVPANVASELEKGCPVRGVEVKETERLAFVVNSINRECSLVPKYTFLRAPNPVSGSYEVKANRAFTGLTEEEAQDMKNYVHQFKADDIDAMSLVEKKKLDQTVDFLDSVESDKPKGCWSIFYEPSARAVYVRNLNWPGFLFYTEPNKNKFGNFYVGYGDKNRDVVFMM